MDENPGNRIRNAPGGWLTRPVTAGLTVAVASAAAALTAAPAQESAR